MCFPRLFAAALLVLARVALAGAPQETKPQLPPELSGAKVYTVPTQAAPGETVESPVIYRKISFHDINLERLTLNLEVSIRPVERDATVRAIHFQGVLASGLPIQVEPFEGEFKVSKKEIVDLPQPLRCSIVFSDLSSVKPLLEMVERDSVHIAGRSFIEVKLGFLHKVALRTRRLVLPVELNDEIPLEMFSDSPLMRAAAMKILRTLADPATEAAAALARQHLAKLTSKRNLTGIARSSLLLVYSEFVLRDPASRREEKFSEVGTGVAIPGGGILTAKRVLEPWKFDPELAFLIERHGLKLDESGYRIAAWPAGRDVLSPDSQLNFAGALSTANGTLRKLKTLPDQMVSQPYRDPESGEEATVRLHAAGANDLAILDAAGAQLEPVTLAESPPPDQDSTTALVGFPFGLGRRQAEAQPEFVSATLEGLRIRLSRALNPGEAGAPLVNSSGQVVAFCPSDVCIPAATVLKLVQ
jgi:hypothetical protein